MLHRSLLILLLTALCARADLADKLLNEYNVIIEELRAAHPGIVIESSGSSHEIYGKIRDFSTLSTALKRCIHRREIPLDEYLRGLYHENDGIRRVCYSYAAHDLATEDIKKQLRLTGSCYYTDPFTNQIAWSNTNILKKHIEENHADLFTAPKVLAVETSNTTRLKTTVSPRLEITCDYHNTELRVILANLLHQSLNTNKGAIKIGTFSEKTLSQKITLRLKDVPLLAYANALQRQAPLNITLNFSTGKYHITEDPLIDTGLHLTRTYPVTADELKAIGLTLQGKAIKLPTGTPWPGGDGETATYNPETQQLNLRATPENHHLLDSLLFITRNSKQAVNIKDHLPKQ